MSRTVKGAKACGYDYWGKRAISSCSPGRSNKKLTLGVERMREHRLVADELDLVADVNNDFEHEVQVLKVL
jgi:hypothetical protein